MIERWLKLDAGKSLLLLGLRRAGKTTLLKYSFPDAGYLTLDDYDFLTMAEKDPKGLLEQMDAKKPLIIDEIQRVPKLTIAVKNRIDNFSQKIFMTGSSSLELLSTGAETLAGRIKILECPTLCFGEKDGLPMGEIFEYKHNSLMLADAQRKLDHYIKFGGFPEVAVEADDIKKMEILKDYKNSYFTKDLLLFSNIEDSRGLLACMHYLSASLGSKIDVSAVAKESMLSHPTAKKYLNVLESSRLLFRLTGFQFGPAKRQIKRSKYYFSDTSISTALGIQMSEGQLFELFVISELEKHRKLGAFNCDQFYYYETEKGSEIDLIIDEGETVTAIEIKNTSNPDKSDVKNLESFSLKNRTASLRRILICRATEFSTIGSTEVWPACSLYRVK